MWSVIVVLKRISASVDCHCVFKRISAVWSVIVCLRVSAVCYVIVFLRVSAVWSVIVF